MAIETVGAMLYFFPAALMLVGTHLFMDRLIDPFRSQQPVATALARLAPAPGARDAATASASISTV